jgi:hypothetical protein
MYRRVGDGAVASGAVVASKSFMEPEPHKNDAAPEHCTVL